MERLTRAFETADVDGIIALLTEDAWLTMPPLPLEYQGRELAARFLTATAFRPGWTARLIPTRANGQPAFGFYARDPGTGGFYTVGLMVLTLSGTQISRHDPLRPQHPAPIRAPANPRRLSTHHPGLANTSTADAGDLPITDARASSAVARVQKVRSTRGGPPTAPQSQTRTLGGYFSAAAARLITRRDKRNREVRILPAG